MTKKMINFYIIYDGRAEPSDHSAAAVLGIDHALDHARASVRMSFGGEGVIFGYVRDGENLSQETYIETWRHGQRFDLTSD